MDTMRGSQWPEGQAAGSEVYGGQELCSEPVLVFAKV